MDIDLRSASIKAIMAHIAESMQEHIRQQESVTDFIERSGVPRATLYRFFDGENIGIDNFIRILRGLDRMDVLLLLTEKPEPSPLDLWQSGGPKM